jgi:serine O-acetyltransferase
MPLDVRELVTTILARDPAARSPLEVLLCYPSVHVQVAHAFAHALYRRGSRLLPRMLSQFARSLTGIEIHPGARIGRRLFLDHGMGIVIGETAEIGDDCLIYHGVTLGGTGKESAKRHPTVGNGVVIGAGAKVLGNITIGDGARIGANSVVLRDVPPGATVVGIPGRVVAGRDHAPPPPDRHVEVLPDPEAEAIRALARRVEALEGRRVTAPLTRSAFMPELEPETASCLPHELPGDPVQLFIDGAGI